MSCAISTRAVLSPKLLTAHSPHSDPNTNTHSVIPPCSSSTPSTINTYTSSHHHHLHHHHHHHYQPQQQQQKQQQQQQHQFQHFDTQLCDTPSDTNHSLGPPYRRSPSPSPNRLCYHRRRPLSRNPAHSPLSRYPASAPCDSDMHAHSLAYPKPSTSSLFASVPTSASASTSSSASASANTCASASVSASAFASASVSIPSSKFISAVPTPPAPSPTAAAYDPLLLRRLDALARVPSSSLPRAPSPQSPPRKHSTSGHVPLPDLPPLSPLSSLCDARSPSASTGSASASAPSDDDVAVAPIVPPMASAVPSNSAPPVIPPQPRARAPALGVAAAAARGRQFDLYMPDRRRPKNLHHPPSTRRASVDVRRPSSDLPESASLTRVSSLKTLDLPVGLVEEIPALPRPQTPSRLPRSRVFIKPSPTRSSVDAASVDCAPSGEHLFVTRDVAPRRDSHSDLARPPHPPIHYSHSNWPNLVDDVPALRNSRHRHTSSVSSSGAPSSARFYFSDDDGEAPDEGDTADVDGDSALALQKHKLPPVPNIAQLLDPHEPVSSLDILAPGSAPLPRHPPLFAHEDAISPFSANAPPSSDALSSRVRRAVSALRSISFQNANSEDCDTAWGQAPPPPSTSPPFSLRPASADVRGVPSATPLASRWRRPRGRISSKHGVLEYESRSEHDPSSRRPSESAVPLSGRPAPPSVRARGSSQSWQKRSLWTSKRDSYEPGARAARLLVSNGPQAVLAASNDDASKSNYLDAPETAIVEPTPAPPVDKYVEFIHASATRGVKTKSSNLPSKVIHRAQAVFRRRWK